MVGDKNNKATKVSIELRAILAPARAGTRLTKIKYTTPCSLLVLHLENWGGAKIHTFLDIWGKIVVPLRHFDDFLQF
jgi:hypothetical protein